MRRLPSASRSLTLLLLASLPLVAMALAALGQSADGRKPKPPGGGYGAGKGAADEAKQPPTLPREEYFKGWPKPKLAIVITGRQDGYIEPCGCAGLENQKGGLSRRDTFLAGLAKRGWPLLPIDVGGLVHRFGKQAEIKFGMSVEALKMMGYQAVGFGPDDLRLSAGEIAAVVAGQNADRQHLRRRQRRPVRSDAHRVKIDRGRRHARSASPRSWATNIKSRSTIPRSCSSPPPRRCKAVMPKLKDCDLRILLAHATLAETEDAGRRLSAVRHRRHGRRRRRAAQSARQDRRHQRQVDRSRPQGNVRRRAGLVRRSQAAAALSARGPRLAVRLSPRMKQLMEGLSIAVRPCWAWTDWACGRSPIRAASGHDKKWGEFAGVKSCENCHPTAYEVWKNSKHAHATESLVKADPPRSVRSGVHQLPRHRLESAGILSLRHRLCQLEADARAGRQHVRELSRSGGSPRGGRKRQGHAPSAKSSGPSVRLTKAPGRAKRLHQVPRPGQQPQLQQAGRFRKRLLAEGRALGEEVGEGAVGGAKADEVERTRRSRSCRSGVDLPSDDAKARAADPPSRHADDRGLRRAPSPRRVCPTQHDRPSFRRGKPRQLIGRNLLLRRRLAYVPRLSPAL